MLVVPGARRGPSARAQRHSRRANSDYILSVRHPLSRAPWVPRGKPREFGMPSASDWKVPAAVRPKPRDYAYDLDQALAAVVGVRSIIPGDAFSAETLGTERAGNGVLIRRDGLVLTIGYLITEAETIWLTLSDGRAVPGHALGYDQETGFGLVQALARLDLPQLALGQSSGAPVGEPVVVAGAVPAATTRWRPTSPPDRNSPAIGNTCSTRRSSPRRPIPTGAAPRSSARRAI